MVVGWNFAQRGFASCEGQLMAISSNSALFSLLGTTFGGDGRTTFGLPDLRGRSIVGQGRGPGLSQISWGEKGGAEQITLTSLHLPAHSHPLINGAAKVDVATTVYTTDNGDVSAESDNGANGLGTSGAMPEIYRENPGTGDHIAGVSSVATISGTTASAGSQQPFSNRNPYLGMWVTIATQGIYPSRS